MTTNVQPLIKFKSQQNETWTRPVFRKEFCLERMSSGADRLCFTTDNGFVSLLLSLSEAMAEPFYFLYVLIVSRRAEHDEARYQSPELSREKLRSFLSYNTNFFEQDGRHSLWIHSPTDNATIVYDRHEIGHAYGLLEGFKSILANNGLKEVHAVERYDSVPHDHNYHSEFDDEENSVIKTFEWRKSPLREQDRPK